MHRHLALMLVAFLVLAAATADSQAPSPSPAKEPPNEPAEIRIEAEGLTVLYAGQKVLSLLAEESTDATGSKNAPSRYRLLRAEDAATAKPAERVLLVEAKVTRGEHDAVTQVITIRPPAGQTSKRVSFRGRTPFSVLHVETRHAAQRRLPLVRTVVGRSWNLRNNAAYSRSRDWLLSATAEHGAEFWSMRAFASAGGGFSADGESLRLTFRPRYYGKHKNLSFFRPWEYEVWRDSVTGWCSWWPYRGKFSEKDLSEVLAVFREKRLDDFGYRYIQIDDAFQREPCGPPATWLEWNEKFPSGIDGYVKAVRSAGFEAGIWIGAMFHDKKAVDAHPDRFVPGPDGQPVKAPWLGYAVDAGVPEALDTLVRPIFRGLLERGFTYVKVDTLRHLLYDAMYEARDHFKARGDTVERAFRRYLATVREEWGRDRFLLACWGVFPEVTGVADGCRLGTDRFGPAKLQQYNSWNGIVWRNDPDHCDILPEGGDVADTMIRPALVSMAGAMLMLSDRAEVYRDDRNLEGVKRASPILFSVPGQIYDVDPVTSDNVVKGLRPTKGAGPGPIDAKHDRPVTPWWLMEIDRPFERWYVLARFSFDAKKPLEETRVSFRDLGIPFPENHVHEFRTGAYLGACEGGFTAAAQPGKSVRIYVIRPQTGRPQLLTTSRHITQGGVDLEHVEWHPAHHLLAGQSRVVAGDPYRIKLVVPAGYRLAGVTWNDGAEQAMDAGGPVVEIAPAVPTETGVLHWSARFREAK